MIDALMMCRGLGKANEAEPLCRRALQIREGTYGADSPNAATALTALADVLKDMNRYVHDMPSARFRAM